MPQEVKLEKEVKNRNDIKFGNPWANMGETMGGLSKDIFFFKHDTYLIKFGKDHGPYPSISTTISTPATTVT